MLRIKVKGKKATEVIPAGHDTKLSDDGKTLAVIDKDGNQVEGVSFDPASVIVVVRV
jgi:hypothetical protein